MKERKTESELAFLQPLPGNGRLELGPRPRDQRVMLRLVSTWMTCLLEVLPVKVFSILLPLSLIF